MEQGEDLDSKLDAMRQAREDEKTKIDAQIEQLRQKHQLEIDKLNRLEAVGDGLGGDDENAEHLRDLALEVPVIRMVNLIIARAVEARAGKRRRFSTS